MKINALATRRLLLAGLVLGLGVLGAALAPEASAQEKIYQLSIVNNKFEPTEIEVPADTKFKLKVMNKDATPEEFESLALRREKVIAGKSEAIINLGPLPPGRYEFFGEFHPKTARGWIVVK